jgi:hypothetical protein
MRLFVVMRVSFSTKDNKKFIEMKEKFGEEWRLEMAIPTYSEWSFSCQAG